MGRGRKAKPVELKILQGNPGKRPLNMDAPKPSSEIPKCPSWLDGEAKNCWKRNAKELNRIGLLTLIDADALVQYCVNWSQWVEAIGKLYKHGSTYPILDENGKLKYIQQSPYVSIARHLQQEIRAFAVEFGMTPSSRGKLVIPGKEEKLDPLEEFLARGKANNS